MRQPEVRGQEKLPAPSGKTSPLGLESTKAGGATVGIWELEDQRQLERIACLKWKEAAAMESINDMYNNYSQSKRSKISLCSLPTRSFQDDKKGESGLYT
ncbi:hypothetical protein A3841_08045 [Pontibacter flavimaris]|uniref:Uncharacterized protein n=1 Tax=Pontibacter flavimaris TaxID=1797110 RepID=A0A1Q5PIA4_9BACT|nr:hypothetical protein A3841_08045 [Pontibacter flavimaris]